MCDLWLFPLRLQVICEKIFRPWFSPTLLGAKAALPLQVMYLKTSSEVHLTLRQHLSHQHVLLCLWTFSAPHQAIKNALAHPQCRGPGWLLSIKAASSVSVDSEIILIQPQPGSSNVKGKLAPASFGNSSDGGIIIWFQRSNPTPSQL